MARTVRDATLESRTARARLKSAAKPYYRAIEEGLHLGYRKGKSAGKWVMRIYRGTRAPTAAGKVPDLYQVMTIGTADDTIDADGAAVLSYPQAQALARRLFVEGKRVAADLPAVAAGPYTVTDCITDYVRWLEANRKTARDARWRADALILPSLGGIVCSKLTTKTLRAWMEAAAKAPPRLRTRKGKAQQYRDPEAGNDPHEAVRRRRASVNRTLTILKAALNHAWREKEVPADDAWRALRPFREADSARVRYLLIEESQRLINAADPDFRHLVQAALQTGARFGELAALTVGDFSPDSGTVHVRTSKSGTGRHIVLTEEGAELFRQLTVGRSPADRLLTKAGGGRWLKSHQSRPMADTCARAKIEPPANFHALRHTYASLTIMNGAPLMVVARNLGHADTRMVEKHYGHLAASYIADAIRAAAPRFGTVYDSNVVAMRGAP